MSPGGRDDDREPGESEPCGRRGRVVHRRPEWEVEIRDRRDGRRERDTERLGQQARAGDAEARTDRDKCDGGARCALHARCRVRQEWEHEREVGDGVPCIAMMLKRGGGAGVEDQERPEQQGRTGRRVRAEALRGSCPNPPDHREEGKERGDRELNEVEPRESVQCQRRGARDRTCEANRGEQRSGVPRARVGRAKHWGLATRGRGWAAGPAPLKRRASMEPVAAVCQAAALRGAHAAVSVLGSLSTVGTFCAPLVESRPFRMA